MHSSADHVAVPDSSADEIHRETLEIKAGSDFLELSDGELLHVRLRRLDAAVMNAGAAPSIRRQKSLCRLRGVLIAMLAQGRI
jgi:hypothetical protein